MFSLFGINRLFVVIGLNQQTPLAYREQIAINSSNLSTSICQIQQLQETNACTILSTCNRTEIYAETSSPDSLMQWLKNHHLGIWSELEPFLYCYTKEQALIHTLQVACGLDSMLIGEPQIFGQLKQACHLSIELGCMNEQLKNLFDFVFQITKKIRTQSGINEHPISVASVAVDCIMQHFTDLKDKKVLLIGSGETAKLSAIHLQEKGCDKFLVTSRHLDNARQLAEKLLADAFPVTELNHYLHQADIIVTATSCPFPFISRQAIENALHQRQQKPMVLVDLAVPRDIEADVAELATIVLINIDHLQEIQAQNQAERLRAAKIAESMIQDALTLYAKKQKSQQAQHLICDYRSHMKNLAQTEVERAHQKLAAGHCQFEVLTELSERLIQKLVHYPTIGMQQAAGEDRQDLLELAQYLFNPHRNDTVIS
jgi:glutamyl-tRNA reductase